MMPKLRSALPEERRPRLKAMLGEKRVLRIMECHSPLSAILAERARDQARRFDALWVSGFSHATMLGLPDAGLSILESRVGVTADIAARTSLPLLADGDTGGDATALRLLCGRLEALGVSGIVVEDKMGAKRSSLADHVEHALEDPEVFCERIGIAKNDLCSDEFLIFARIESLIAGQSIESAAERARHYLRSRADGLVIHSKDATGREILGFLEAYGRLQRELRIEKPLICIPTAYSQLSAQELYARGATIVIFANHMIRAAFKAMEQVASVILQNDRAREADSCCAPVSEIFDLLGAGDPDRS